jgi:hypothetical protein
LWEAINPLNWRKAMDDERNTPLDEGAEVEAHLKGHKRSEEDAEVEAHLKGHKRSEEPGVLEDAEDEVEAHQKAHH